MYHCAASSVLCGIEKNAALLIWLPEMGLSIVDLLLMESSLVIFGSKEMYAHLNGINFPLSPALLLSLLHVKSSSDAGRMCCMLVQLRLESDQGFLHQEEAQC